MWPYDYFNQYSALINEFNLERNNEGEKSRKIFISRRYYSNKVGENKQRIFFEKLIGELNKESQKYVLSDRSVENDNDFLKYKFELTMPVKAGKDDINKEILANIIEASLVICDITPQKHKGKLIFNANVVAELAMALAWKMPEQVVVLWDTNRVAFLGKELPFNIKNYFIKDVNFSYDLENIVEIVRSRNQEIVLEKSIIVKNILRKLDRDSLKVLEGHGGLTSPLKDDGNVSLNDTVRHLLTLGLIETEIFPLSGENPMRTYTYLVTDIGRFILQKALKHPEVFSKRFADFMNIYHWAGHKEHKELYQGKLADFKNDYKIAWIDCDEIFRELLVEEKSYFTVDGNLWPAFKKFRKGKSFDSIRKCLISPWDIAVNKRIRS